MCVCVCPLAQHGCLVLGPLRPEPRRGTGDDAVRSSPDGRAPSIPPGAWGTGDIDPAMLPPGPCCPRLFSRGVSRRIRPRQQVWGARLMSPRKESFCLSPDVRGHARALRVRFLKPVKPEVVPHPPPQPQNPGVISERRYITSFQLFRPDSKTSSRYASEPQAGCPLTCNAHTQNSLHSSERGKTSLTRLSSFAPAPALLMEADGGSAGMRRHAPVQEKGAHVNRQQEPPGPISPPA